MEQLDLHLFHRNDHVRRNKHNCTIDISYFQHRRWQLIILFEQFSGFWPHQSKLQQHLLQLFHSFILLTVFSASANKLYEYVGVDLTNDVAIESCIAVLTLLALISKLRFALINQHSRREVYEKVAKHFELMKDPEEAAVLSEGAEQGFKCTLYYMYKLSVASAIFFSVPVLRAFYDYFSIHDKLRIQLPIPLNYGFDHHEYWYIIVLDIFMCICTALLVEFATSLSFNMIVWHVANLFKIVVIRLRKASEFANEFGNETISGDAADESYSLISSAIDLHSECFELVKLIEKSYTLIWFMLLLLTTGIIGAGVHVVSTKLDDPMDAFRYIMAFMVLIAHFQAIFSRSQLIIDSAKSVSDVCCECKWYGLSKKSRKLLLMMIIRTSIPCQLTGAKLFPLSMETFGKMLRVGLSYYTVFRSKGK